MAGDAAFDITEVGNFAGYMFAQLYFPSLSILFDTFTVPRCKRVGIDALVLRLRPENYRGFCCIHLCFFKQKIQIEQVAALKALEHAA